MNYTGLRKGFFILAILICTQVTAWALNNNVPRFRKMSFCNGIEC